MEQSHSGPRFLAITADQLHIFDVITWCHFVKVSSGLTGSKNYGRHAFLSQIQLSLLFKCYEEALAEPLLV